MNGTTIVLIVVSIALLCALLALGAAILITVCTVPLKSKSTNQNLSEKIEQGLPRILRSAPRFCILSGVVAASACFWYTPDLRVLLSAVSTGGLVFLVQRHLWRNPDSKKVWLLMAAWLIPYWLARKLFLPPGFGVLTQYLATIGFVVYALVWAFRKAIAAAAVRQPSPEA